MPTHSERRVLPYTAAQMYDLVADVGRYPEFLPWNSAARIRTRKPASNGSEVMEADLVISFKVFRERFGSRVTLWPARDAEGWQKIETEYLDGPFKYMKAEWKFRDLPPEAGAGAGAGAGAASEAPSGCEIAFFVDFEFRNAILQKIIGVVFGEAMNRIVRAFETRAVALYGKP